MWLFLYVASQAGGSYEVKRLRLCATYTVREPMEGRASLAAGRYDMLVVAAGSSPMNDDMTFYSVRGLMLQVEGSMV